jgi:hypothetical protein
VPNDAKSLIYKHVHQKSTTKVRKSGGFLLSGGLSGLPLRQQLTLFLLSSVPMFFFYMTVAANFFVPTSALFL